MPGEENTADLFTKHLETERKLQELVKLFNCQFRGGRPTAAPAPKKAARAGQTEQAHLVRTNILPR